MTKNGSTMKAQHGLSGLIKFLDRPIWRDPFAEILDQHVGAALDEFGVAFEEIDGLLGDVWSMTLWGCAFEDFLTRALEPDGRNIVDDYLRRRGFKETARTRAYMKALQSSVMSLYEVSEIQPGRALLARDLIRGGEPVLVREKTATQTLRPWDRVAVRIVNVNDSFIFAGGLLPFPAAACGMLLGGLRAAMDARVTDGTALLDDDQLRAAAPLISAAWLFDALSQALDDAPLVLLNSDGDDLLFHELRFPLAKGIRRDFVATRLDTSLALRRESETFWNWLASPRSASLFSNDPNAKALEVTTEDGRTVLGSVELQGRTLLLLVNASARAVRGTAMLKDLLGRSLLAPTTIVRTVEELSDERDGEPAELTAEIAEPLVHELLDRRYRQMLDEPIPMIGGVSPREAVRTAEGRSKVVDWLKHLENHSAGACDPDEPIATYDFSWLWQELGIAVLRR